MTKQELEDEVSRWRMLYLDQPEDRLWHDKDRTWWTRRDDTYLGVGALYRAEPPEPLKAIRALLVKFVDQAKTKRSRAEWILKLAKQAEKALK